MFVFLVERHLMSPTVTLAQTLALIVVNLL
jgi:hypothetical protein